MRPRLTRGLWDLGSWFGFGLLVVGEERGPGEGSGVGLAVSRAARRRLPRGNAFRFAVP